MKVKIGKAMAQRPYRTASHCVALLVYDVPTVAATTRKRLGKAAHIIVLFLLLLRGTWMMAHEACFISQHLAHGRRLRMAGVSVVLVMMTISIVNSHVERVLLQTQVLV